MKYDELYNHKKSKHDQQNFIYNNTKSKHDLRHFIGTNGFTNKWFSCVGITKCYEK